MRKAKKVLTTLKDEVGATAYKVGSELAAKLRIFTISDAMRPTNVWIQAHGSEIYVRKVPRLLEGRMVVSLDLANLQISEDHQRQGIAGRLLGVAERLMDADYVQAVYVENVQVPGFVDYLLRRGFRAQASLAHGAVVTLYKLRSE